MCVFGFLCLCGEFLVFGFFLFVGWFLGFVGFFLVGFLSKFPLAFGTLLNEAFYCVATSSALPCSDPAESVYSINGCQKRGEEDKAEH